MTVKSTVPPSGALAPVIASSGGASSSMIVPAAEAVEITALSTPDRSSVNVSSASWTSSPTVATATVRTRVPGAKVSVPLAGS